MKFKNGFTLIEVVVVIGIIAILTVIIFPSISNIRAKNRDTERVADISAIQLGLSLYKNQSDTNSYPISLDALFDANYVTEDSIIDPNGGDYEYVPLTRSTTPNVCTYYHLGTVLELPSSQIDAADNYNSTLSGGKTVSGGYNYCGGYVGDGLINSTTTRTYAVHP